jgi:hypothetical protein
MQDDFEQEDYEVGYRKAAQEKSVQKGNLGKTIRAA